MTGHQVGRFHQSVICAATFRSKRAAVTSKYQWEVVAVAVIVDVVVDIMVALPFFAG